MTTYWVIKRASRYLMRGDVWGSKAAAVRFFSKAAAMAVIGDLRRSSTRGEIRVVKVTRRAKSPAAVKPAPTGRPLCSRCHQQPAARGRKTCDECLECERVKRKALVAERAAAGLCTECGGPKPADRYKMCKDCRSYAHGDWSVRYARMKEGIAKGLCIRCGQPSVRKNRCEHCLAKFEAFSRNLLAKRRKERLERAKAGLCTRCGGKRDLKGWLCSGCLEDNRAAQRKHAHNVYGPKQDKRYKTTGKITITLTENATGEEKARKIREARAAGMSYGAISAILGIPKGTVAGIATRKHFK